MANILGDCRREERRRFSSRASAAWARLIHKVYEANPLTYQRCGATMRVIAPIDDPVVVRKILEHLGLWNPPPEDSRERAPPPLPGEAWLAARVLAAYPPTGPRYRLKCCLLPGSARVGLHWFLESACRGSRFQKIRVCRRPDRKLAKVSTPRIRASVWHATVTT